MAKINVYRSLLPSGRVIGWDIKMTSYPNSNASFINIWDRLIWRQWPNLTRSSSITNLGVVSWFKVHFLHDSSPITCWLASRAFKPKPTRWQDADLAGGFQRVQDTAVYVALWLDQQTSLWTLWEASKNTYAPNPKTWMFLVSACSCLCAIYWRQVWSGEWRCSWSSADWRCFNYIWVINNLIAY